jgi:CheY-like chemotaxis protein
VSSSWRTHDDSREILAQSLTDEGATVMAAAAAKDALREIARADVVVTDLAMPNNDGIWLLNEINALSRPVPVIVLSGFHESQNSELRAAPFIRKLLKPVAANELSRAIREVLRGVMSLSEHARLLLGLLKPVRGSVCTKCVADALSCSPEESLKATKELISNGLALAHQGPCARCSEVRPVTRLRR